MIRCKAFYYETDYEKHLPCDYPTIFYTSLSAEDLTEPNIERYIKIMTDIRIMHNSRRNVYVCFSKEEIVLLEEYARKKGALNISQALESLVKDSMIKNLN